MDTIKTFKIATLAIAMGTTGAAFAGHHMETDEEKDMGAETEMHSTQMKSSEMHSTKTSEMHTMKDKQAMEMEPGTTADMRPATSSPIDEPAGAATMESGSITQTDSMPAEDPTEGETFFQLDENNNGYISKEEAGDSKLDSSFSDLDKDDDGKLSAEEYSEYQPKSDTAW